MADDNTGPSEVYSALIIGACPTAGKRVFLTT